MPEPSDTISKPLPEGNESKEAVCPICRSDLVAIVTVDYERRIDRATGKMQPRGVKVHEQTIVRCSNSKCGAELMPNYGGHIHA